MKKCLILWAATIALAITSPASSQSLIQGEVAGGMAGNGLPGSAKAVSVDPDGSVRTKCVSGCSGGGGGGATGSVTPAGQNGTAAQAVQGINGGVPVATTTAPLSGAQEQDVRSSGTLSAATANAAITIPLNGQGTAAFTFAGLAASGATLAYEQSNDGGTTWTAVSEVNTGTGVASTTRTTDGQVRVNAAGHTNLRVRVATTGTGTITVAYSVSVREGIVALGSPLPPGANDIGQVLVGNDGTTNRKLTTTTTGAIEPPTAAAGKITRTSTALAANTSTTIAAANAARIGMGLQCGLGAVSVDETGATLTAAGVGNGTLFIPSGSAPYFTPPVATRTAVTAYTATAQTCVVTEYLR